MENNLILLNYYNNLELLLDRAIVFIVIFALLLVGAITRNTLFDNDLRRSEMVIATLFLALMLIFVASKLINILDVFFFPAVLLAGLLEKELISKIRKGKLAKLITNFLANGGINEN